MDRKDDNSPANLWARRSNSSKLNLSMNKHDSSNSTSNHANPVDTTAAKRFSNVSGHVKNNPFNNLTSISTASGVSSPPATGASASFGLGSGAFASFGSANKTPRTPGTAFDWGKAAGAKREGQTVESGKDEKDNKTAGASKPSSSVRNFPASTEIAPVSAKDASQQWPLKSAWVVHYRPPTGKNNDYEKSIKPLCKINTAQDFWQVYSHLKRPSALPAVSDYHIFKDGIRPVWEDDANKSGGKWIVRVKKGVADRYWEELLLALVGDQFTDASDEVCGAVVSVRQGEDVFSIWTRNDGGKNVKIRETIKRVLSLPADTNLQWRSHDESITQRTAVDQARQEKPNYGDKRRNNINAERERKDESVRS